MCDSLPVGISPILRVFAMPDNSNPYGDVFGGWIMAQVDIAGGITAARSARSRVVTVAANDFVFLQAVRVGDLLSFYASEVRRGNTSLTIQVEVFAERSPTVPQILKVAQARLTYVAVDEHGNKKSLPDRTV